MPIDPNTASPAELALVEGLSPRLGAAIVAERRRRGPFTSLAQLDSVPGIGPKRLAQARAGLAIGAATQP
jgi:competence protein ComEA